MNGGRGFGGAREERPTDGRAEDGRKNAPDGCWGFPAGGSGSEQWSLSVRVWVEGGLPGTPKPWRVCTGGPGRGSCRGSQTFHSPLPWPEPSNPGLRLRSQLSLARSLLSRPSRPRWTLPPPRSLKELQGQLAFTRLEALCAGCSRVHDTSVPLCAELRGLWGTDPQRAAPSRSSFPAPRLPGF